MIANSEERSAPESGLAKVSVIIPCRAEYVAIGRLAILGVANRLSYSYDEVEDVRLAVGEACSHAVERAYSATPPADLDLTIWIDSTISAGGLTVEVRDNVPTTSESSSNDEPNDDDGVSFDKQDLGALLMEILVDEVAVDTRPDGTTVRLFKNAPMETSHARAEE